METYFERWSLQNRSLHRQRCSTPYGPARVRFSPFFCYLFSEGSLLIHVCIAPCTHSIPLARQGATREAFSGLCNCRHTAPITPCNTGLCCIAPSSPWYHQSGDFFPVNNSCPYCRALFLLPFTCLHLLKHFVYGLFLSLFLSCRGIMFAVDFCSLYHYSLGREMTLPLDILPRLIWGL
jgi:hypothetical protein